MFMLAECKLAIVHCAGHYDPTLIETLWKEILEKGNSNTCNGDSGSNNADGDILENQMLNFSELHDSSSPSSDRITLLSKKIVTLGKTYVHSERYFPLGKYLLTDIKNVFSLDFVCLLSCLFVGYFPCYFDIYKHLTTA